MAIELVDLGTEGVEGSGDNIREGGQKINDNFTDLGGRVTTIEGEIDDVVTQAQEAADEAAESAQEAAESAALAGGYQGLWEDATGSGTKGWSYYYAGGIWMLLDDVADITATTPSSTNSDWFLVQEESEYIPDVQATIEMDFANNAYRLYESYETGMGDVPAGDIATHARASNATLEAPTGAVAEVASNLPRLTYSEGIAQGYLSEESRTRLNTVSAAPTSTENITVTAQAYTVSFYGAGTMTLSGTYSGSLVGTGDNDRVTLAFTSTAGTLTLTPSGDVTDLQLEAGSFATSLIKGEGSTVTRAADSMVRTLGDEWNHDEWSVFLNAECDGGDNPRIIEISSSTSNRVRIIKPSNPATGTQDFQLVVTNSAGTTSQVITNSGQASKFAVSYKAGEFYVYTDASSDRTSVTKTPDSNYSVFSIGSSVFGGGQNNGAIGMVKSYPKALSDTELVRLTS